MKSSRLLLALGLSWWLVPLFRLDANEIFKFDQAHSTIAFKVRHMLGSAKGKFTKFSGTIEVDRDHPEKSSVVATIQAASIDTANAKRDEHLRTADFFNVQQYPEITFKSRRVKQTGANTGEITGDFTMHGVTRAITLNVQLVGDPASAAKNSTTRWRVTTAPLKRSEFKLGWSKGVETVAMIGDEVSVEYRNRSDPRALRRGRSSSSLFSVFQERILSQIRKPRSLGRVATSEAPIIRPTLCGPSLLSNTDKDHSRHVSTNLGSERPGWEELPRALMSPSGSRTQMRQSSHLLQIAEDMPV